MYSMYCWTRTENTDCPSDFAFLCIVRIHQLICFGIWDIFNTHKLGRSITAEMIEYIVQNRVMYYMLLLVTIVPS